jgi:hypothetical protein
VLEVDPVRPARRVGEPGAAEEALDLAVNLHRR